jgi:nucleotide-binding universal stress UspA family protein
VIRVKTILYPTDFSSYSNSAYFHALGLAEAYRASLTVLHVYTPGDTAPEQAAADRRHVRGQLEQIRPANGAIPVRHVFLEGDPATEIVRYAADEAIDVIVLGTHGRAGVDRLVMGSVAERVMRDASCSVLVVKLQGSRSGENRPAAAVVVGA